MDELVGEIRCLLSIVLGDSESSNCLSGLSGVCVFRVVLLHKLLYEGTVSVSASLDGRVIAKHETSFKLGMDESPEKVVEDMGLRRIVELWRADATATIEAIQPRPPPVDPNDEGIQLPLRDHGILRDP